MLKRHRRDSCPSHDAGGGLFFAEECSAQVAEAPKIYEVGGDIESLRARSKHFLNLYNEEHPSKKMDLVIFDDALLYAISASRCVEVPSRRRRDSCSSDEVVGGLFFEFE